MHGLDAVGVSVGLVVGGEPVVGVVHAPLLDRTYRGAQGWGSVPRRAAHPRERRPPEQAIVATGFPFRRKELLARYEPAFTAALHTFEDLRRVGAASLDLCWTAEGVFDGYFELAARPLGRGRRGHHRAGGGRDRHRLGRRPRRVARGQHPRRPAPRPRRAGGDRLRRRLKSMGDPARYGQRVEKSFDATCGSVVPYPRFQQCPVHRENHPKSEGAERDDDPYVCTQANAPAGVARARVAHLDSCPTVPASWSPIFIGTAMGTKHGRPRRTPVSPT